MFWIDSPNRNTGESFPPKVQRMIRNQKIKQVTEKCSFNQSIGFILYEKIKPEEIKKANYKS